MIIAAPALNFQPKQATLPVKSFLQRLLLVTNGNIDDILQAYTGETVSTVKLHQQLVISGSRLSPLQLQRDYQILKRVTLLQGTKTNINYLYTDLQLVLERLPVALRDEVMFGVQPISKLFQQQKLETYREILDCGIEPAGSLTQYFPIEPDAKLIYRTYLILVNGLPLMQIKERFPSSYFIK
ncbi:MAG: chorismate pyruvate-lyase family protein [Cyanobacteria bacterium P01_A01_bin.40]